MQFLRCSSIVFNRKSRLSTLILPVFSYCSTECQVDELSDVGMHADGGIFSNLIGRNIVERADAKDQEQTIEATHAVA